MEKTYVVTPAMGSTSATSPHVSAFLSHQESVASPKPASMLAKLSQHVGSGGTVNVSVIAPQ